ncbi:MAG TPA: hypothetical protein VFP68_19700 [Burkholderiaceae bacterium]|nr:hypothetical protein [Burkholderiaceae bacterium]
MASVYVEAQLLTKKRMVSPRFTLVKDASLALAGSTPIHKICNVNAQGSWGFTGGACKAAYASLLGARLTGKGITTYYNDNGLTCSTLPSWGACARVLR